MKRKSATIKTNKKPTPLRRSKTTPAHKTTLLSAAKEVRAVLSALYICLGKHWQKFLLGCTAALGVVFARLALPWPLSGISSLLSESGSKQLSWLPTFMDKILLLGCIFLGLMVFLGLSDMVARAAFANFASYSVSDLQKKALLNLHAASMDAKLDNADTVTRLTADAARFKSGISSFLVQVVINGTVFIGVTFVLFSMNLKLGLIFATAGLLTMSLISFSSWKVYTLTQHRHNSTRKMSKHIQATISQTNKSSTESTIKVNESSSFTYAKYVGIATWVTHTIFGIAVLFTLLIGAESVRTGNISSADLLVIMMYALMMRGPIVRLARQGSKSGKIFGDGYRLVQLSEKDTRYENTF